ncbi:MAG TPA: serine/threonine-protein kinase [Vicinamibacterales bacterium]|nr:serine/threonine-protein kinase [Vicinamibacterales bacterium]
MLAPGDVIDSRYEVIAPLAEGGMGAVYRARRTLLGDEVAIKVVRQDSPDPSSRERFLHESRIAARLRHPSIVSIFDFDMPPGSEPYLVMELLSGPSVAEEIAARGRLELGDVQRIVPGICSALQLAHAHGVVHRDIKPANIVAHDYDAGPRVYKLVDFGIANLRRSTIETRLTGEGRFIGTLAYAAPEQLSGLDVSARTDVYALAAVVFEMLTGRLPFGDGDIMSVVTAQMIGEVPRVRTVRPELPLWLDAAIAKGMAKDPASRWASAADFGAALFAGAAAPLASTSDGSTRPLAILGGTYEVGERIGPGRLGSDVHRGVHRALGHPVAIRILRSESHPSWAAARERFLREAKALQIAHESIIQVRDYGEELGLVYLVTDLIEGPSVRALLQGSGPIPWQRLRPLLAQLLEAARLLHRRRALLCGLSPEIMRIRLPAGAGRGSGDADDEEEERLMISTAGIWTAQDLLATLHDRTLRGIAMDDAELRYVAPELLTGGSVDTRSDIFTIGVLAYEMATGVVPFDGKSMPELLGRMLSGAHVDPRLLAPDLPEPAAAAIVRAMRASPAERFATVREFAAAIG